VLSVGAAFNSLDEVTVHRLLEICAEFGTRIVGSVHETVARRDAGPKPTGTYLRRVSWAGLATLVCVAEYLEAKPFAAKAAPT
jgi:hypothetical protein